MSPDAALHRITGDYCVPIERVDTYEQLARRAGQEFSPHAHLGADGVVRYVEFEPATLYSITHEIAHAAAGTVEPDDETRVLALQCEILCQFATLTADWS